jgi:hypothetical protein
MIKNDVVLAEPASDIELGIDFHNAIKDGVGLYFRDSIIGRPGINDGSIHGLIFRIALIRFV